MSLSMLGLTAKDAGNTSAYASSTETDFEHAKCRRPLTLRVCSANVPVYACLALASVVMLVSIVAYWYGSCRGTGGISAVTISSQRDSSPSLLVLEEPPPLHVVGEPTYNVTDNYFKSDFIPVPNFSAKKKE